MKMKIAGTIIILIGFTSLTGLITMGNDDVQTILKFLVSIEIVSLGVVALWALWTET
jgi:hypothetical protein